MRHLAIVLLFLAVSPVSLSLSSKLISSFEAGINISGAIYGDVREAKVMVPVPKETAQVKSSHPFTIKRDGKGNRVAVIDAGKGEYWLYVRVNNSAKECEKPIPREIIDATLSAYSYMTYDPNLGNETKGVEWILENRRGTCDEYAVLLSHNLSSMGYVTRYVSGYAYSSPSDTVLRKHSWVQVLLNGTWVDLDPTWGEVCFLDASHIPVMVSDAPQTEERVEYVGSLEKWEVSESFEIADMDFLGVSASSEYRGGKEGVVLVNATFPGCMAYEIEISPCQKSGRDAIKFYPAKRTGFSCNSSGVFFLYESEEAGTCPVGIYFNGQKVSEIDILLRDAGGPEIMSPPFANSSFTASSSPPSMIYYGSSSCYGNCSFMPLRGMWLICAVNKSATCNQIYGGSEDIRLRLDRSLIGSTAHSDSANITHAGRSLYVEKGGVRVRMSRPPGILEMAVMRIIDFLLSLLPSPY